MYSPPSGSPPSTSHPSPADLLPTPDSKVDLGTLARQGWVSIPLREFDPSLYSAYDALFTQSAAFFDLPADEKMKFHIPAHEQTSEEGFSVVKGEKSLITLRRKCNAPDILRPAAEECWSATGDLLDGVMKHVARSVGLEEDKFDNMVKPCCSLPENERVATLLRMFRYIRPEETQEAKIVAEPHRDLGLLTLVVGSSPGLEVFAPAEGDAKDGRWVSIEENEAYPQGELTATLLSGATLLRLTNGIYNPGRHRVLVHPSSRDEPSPYRFSLVFALRAHLPVVVSSKMFTTPVTGSFSYPFGEDKEVRMGDIYQAISNAHFNINIDKEVREEQRKRVLANGGGHTHASIPIPPPEVANTAPSRRGSLSGRVKWRLKNLFGRIKIAW